MQKKRLFQRADKEVISIPGTQLQYASIVASAIDYDDKLKDKTSLALSYIDKAINYYEAKEIPVYPKTYYVKALLLFYFKKFSEAERYVKKAIAGEDKTNEYRLYALLKYNIFYQIYK